MTTAPPELAALTHRIRQVYVANTSGDDDPPLMAHTIRPFVAAVRPDRLLVSWVRGRPRGAVSVFVDGPAVGQDDHGQVAIAFPAGAVGAPVAPAEVGSATDHLVWHRCELMLDASSMVEESTAPTLEGVFGGLPDRPQGFLVVARGARAAEEQTELDRLSDAVADLERHRAGRGEQRRLLARAEEDLGYLDRTRPAGLWVVEFWVAGASAAEAAKCASLLGDSADVAGSPFRVRAASTAGTGGEQWRSSILVGGEAVAVFARPPGREVPGCRVAEIPDFDHNLEISRGDLTLGRLLDSTRTMAAPLRVDEATVNRHVFVTGATGSGKSETVRRLLGSLHGRGVPWLVVEPAKSEYRSMARSLGTTPLVVIRPGAADEPPAGLNPLEPSSIHVSGTTHTFPLQTHLDLLRGLFEASFEPTDPFPQVLASALTRTYDRAGWNVALGRADRPGAVPPPWPSLGDLNRTALEVVDEIGYGTEVRDNVRGFVAVRLEHLRQGTAGRFLEGGHPLDLDALMRGPALLEIEDLGDDRDKAFVIGLVVIRLVEVLRLRQKHQLQGPGLNHVLVIEEAHRLLRRIEPGAPGEHAVSMFANLLAEVRAYGEGLVVAEQIPVKVVPDVVKNSALKIMHRLPSLDDREFVGGGMNLDEEQSRFVVSLPPGEAAVHAAGMDRPVLARIERLPEQGAVHMATAPVGPRTAACATVCHGSPCTLSLLGDSAALEHADHLALWSELTTLAHLTGNPMPAPSGRWLDDVRGGDLARTSCAIGQEVRDAVRRRHHVIRRHYDPAVLEAHVTQLLIDQLSAPADDHAPEKEWVVAQFRFRGIAQALNSPDDDEDPTVPHPATATWASALGLVLPGPSWAEQLEQLYSEAPRVSWLKSADLVGQPSRIGEVAGRLGHGSTGAARLEAAVGELGVVAPWVTHVVRLEEVR